MSFSISTNALLIRLGVMHVNYSHCLKCGGIVA